MLQELAQWEEAAAIKEMLTSNSSQLTGCHVNVCNVQQPQNWISGVVTYHNTQTKVCTCCINVDIKGNRNSWNLWWILKLCLCFSDKINYKVYKFFQYHSGSALLSLINAYQNFQLLTA